MEAEVFIQGQLKSHRIMVLMLIKGIRRGGESNISFGYPRRIESFHSDIPRARWCNLVCVECL